MTFSAFGSEKAFANPFFEGHLAGHRGFGLLNETALFGEPLTTFLRAEGSRGRLGWINEVLVTGDFDRAHVALSTVAKTHENKLWNQKVELSLSKLVGLAVSERKSKQPAASKDAPATMEAVESALTITSIQNAIYAHIQPLTVSAMDHDAEVQLVTDTYAVLIRTTLPALHQLLEIAFEDLSPKKAPTAAAATAAQPQAPQAQQSHARDDPFGEENAFRNGSTSAVTSPVRAGSPTKRVPADGITSPKAALLASVHAAEAAAVAAERTSSFGMAPDQSRPARWDWPVTPGLPELLLVNPFCPVRHPSRQWFLD